MLSYVSTILRRSSALRAPVATYATKTIYIGNVTWGTEEEELQQFFSQHGQVHSCRLPRDPLGRVKGFGFVEMEDVDAEKAIEALNGTEFKGRNIIVNESRPTAPRERTGNYRSFGNNRDRYGN